MAAPSAPLLVLLAGLLSLSASAQQASDLADLLRRATAGDAMAQVKLGVAYRDGEGVQQDYAQAVTWYRAAADQQLPVAYDHLGWMHVLGHGTPRNYPEARRLFELGAQAGVARAAYNLAEMTYLGLGLTTNDPAAAWTLLEQAARAGSSESCARLATLALFEPDPPGSPHALADLMDQLRRRGQPGAARVLGLQYYLGRGRTQDLALARAVWQEADWRDPVPAPLISSIAWLDLRSRTDQPGTFVFLDLPPLAQGLNLCAVTAGAAALAALGVPADALTLKRRCSHSPLGGGTAWDQLSESLRASGVQVELATFGLDAAAGAAGWTRVRAELDAGRPVLVDFRDPAETHPNRGAHTVVAMGYDESKRVVYVQNTASLLPGVEAYAYDEFLQRWNSRWYMPGAKAECRPALFLRRS